MFSGRCAGAWLACLTFVLCCKRTRQILLASIETCGLFRSLLHVASPVCVSVCLCVFVTTASCAKKRLGRSRWKFETGKRVGSRHIVLTFVCSPRRVIFNMLNVADLTATFKVTLTFKGQNVQEFRAGCAITAVSIEALLSTSTRMPWVTLCSILVSIS